jgi:hypothetical protein
MLQRLSATALFLLTSFLGVAGATPAAPENLTASVTGHTVTLTWLAGGQGSGEDIGIILGCVLNPGSCRYVITASLSPGGPAVASLTVTTSSLTIPNVPDGVYYVRVHAVRPDGHGPPSDGVILVVPGGSGPCPAPPDPPTSLTGSASGSVVMLSWSAPAGGCPPERYAVQAGSAPGLSNVAIANVGAVTFLSAAAPSGSYYLRVVALNAFGGSSPSNEVLLTVGSPPPCSSCVPTPPRGPRPPT